MKKLLVIGGPTGVGKSDYAVELALKYNGEIISADSVQIYRGLDIGSGKLKKEEMKGIPHYLIDIKNPDEEFTVVDFMEAAEKCVEDILKRGKLPIICGGTGFYINAFLNNYQCGVAAPDYELREKLKNMEEENGKGYLADLLYSIDPNCRIKRNDTTRIIRQLELIYSDTKEDLNANRKTYDALLCVMDAERQLLDERSEPRIRKMFDEGFEEEVKKLEPYFSFRSTDTIGYKEVKNGLLNGLSRDEMIAEIRQNYHWLIKKQQTFFRWIKWDNKVSLMNWNFEEANKKIEEYLYES